VTLTERRPNFVSKQNKIQINNTLLYINIFIFVISLGEGIIIPIIPLYADQLGASYSQLGFLITGYSLGFAGLTLLSGRLSDNIGRKKIILIGIVINLIAALGYMLAATVEQVLMARILEGMSRGMIWPLTTAIIADNTQLGNRNRTMGIFTACYGGGIALGTVIGGIIAQKLSYNTVFPAYVVLSMIVFVIVWFNIHEDAGKSHLIEQTPLKKELNKINLKSELKGIMPLAFIGFSFAGLLWTIAALQSKIADTAGFSPVIIGAFFSALWGSRIVAALNMGRVVDKWGRKKVLTVSLIFCLLATLIYPFSQHVVSLLFASVLVGLGTGIIYPLIVSLAADKVSARNRGVAMGFLETAMGFGMILQPAFSGLAGQYIGLYSTYLVGMTFIVFSIMVTVIIINEDYIKGYNSTISLNEGEISELQGGK
jgi:MFS family permease